MTMSTESLPFEETAGTGIEGGNGEATATESGLDPQVASSSGENPDPGSYDDRLREGGDFAVEQAKNWQRKFNTAKTEREKMEGQLRNVETLLPIVDQLGGAQAVISNLERLGRLVGDPKFGPILQQYETQGVIASGAEGGDEYVDPVEAELRGEIQTLRNELHGLRGDSLRQSSTLAQQRLQGHFQEALRGLPLDEDQLARVHTKVEDTLKQWSGTQEGVRALENLDAQSVRTLIRGTFDDDDWIGIVRRMDASRHEERRSHQTDAPATTATGKAASVAKTAIEAAREAFKAEGLDPNGRLIP
jgi:hypothetical protein